MTATWLLEEVIGQRELPLGVPAPPPGLGQPLRLPDELRAVPPGTCQLLKLLPKHPTTGCCPGEPMGAAVVVADLLAYQHRRTVDARWLYQAAGGSAEAPSIPGCLVIATEHGVPRWEKQLGRQLGPADRLLAPARWGEVQAGLAGVRALAYLGTPSAVRFPWTEAAYRPVRVDGRPGLWINPYRAGERVGWAAGVVFGYSDRLAALRLRLPWAWFPDLWVPYATWAEWEAIGARSYAVTAWAHGSPARVLDQRAVEELDLV